MSDDRVSLEMHDGPVDGWPLLRSTASPMIVGAVRRPVDMTCAGCGVVVARGVWERLLMDVLLECSSCGSVLRSRQREAGEPVPGEHVKLEAVRYPPVGTSNIADKPVMMVGPAALAGYAAETGRRAPLPAGTFTDDTGPMTYDSLHEVADFLVDVLGQHYSALKAVDERGQTSATPPEHRHRLLELIEQVRAMADDLRPSPFWRPVTLQGDPLAEALTAMEAFTRWREHPVWPHIVRTLVDDEIEPQHTIMLLTVASYLVDQGNGIGIYPSSRSATIPDMWLDASVDDRVEVEVKTPLRLRAPAPLLLSPASYEKIIEKEYKGSRDQLASADTGLLVIGGYHLGGHLAELEAGARRFLRRRADRRPKLSAVLLADITYTNATGPPGTALFPSVLTRTVPHPGYRGTMKWVQSPEPPPTLLDFLRPV